jgi:hypothetical protein
MWKKNQNFSYFQSIDFEFPNIDIKSKKPDFKEPDNLHYFMKQLENGQTFQNIFS